ncbi:RNase P subunit p30-domain-containing protein [Stachybotrys elegans]|uniref:RNase P subunit p30-domain-containing protein n=1 Tax=Stachybotrys elegans TaxID=80388 RepID=A0A8K0STK9_9HYPO|nr:RNase P subunit p30-domain-containing protein [Stachybotrys elegans]
MAAVARGLRFEICYAQALAADPRGRATFIANATNLIRATRGRGIILSSEASSALALRAPADVVNLLAVWGLGNDKGMDGLRSIPRSVVVNEGIKRNGFRGVIQVIEAAKKPLSPPDQEPGGKNNQKRKNASQDDGTSTISKRQMKKMRLAARAGAEASKK